MNMQEIVNAVVQMPPTNDHKRIAMDSLGPVILSTSRVHPRLVGGPLDQFQSTSNHMI
jgi:hypothetical protein